MLILTRERLTRGWSRQELAARSRLAPGDIGKITRGILVPYQSQLERMAQALEWTGPASELLEEAPDNGTD